MHLDTISHMICYKKPSGCCLTLGSGVGWGTSPHHPASAGTSVDQDLAELSWGWVADECRPPSCPLNQDIWLLRG